MRRGLQKVIAVAEDNGKQKIANKGIFTEWHCLPVLIFQLSLALNGHCLCCSRRMEGAEGNGRLSRHNRRQ